MRKLVIFCFSVLCALFLSCGDKKKKEADQVVEKTQIEVEKIEESLEKIAKEVEMKSKELDSALDALDDL